MNEIIRHSDVDMNFVFNPNTGDISKKVNVDAIKQHICLLFIDDGLLFRPDTRSGIGLSLFESWNSHSKAIAEERILSHLRIYEPRIEVEKVEAKFDYGEGRLEIDLYYYVTEEPNVQIFSFLINSVR